jgi:3-deoxy-manno-octulosonate cytidylyltransferase (CMP-KDO synthetase)
MGSTRLPGKPLADQTGKPLIQHVIENARRATAVSRVAVATDDARIAEAVRAFGGEAVITRTDHPNGTSRLAEAVTLLDAGDELILNVQGDEPEIDPAIIDALVRGLAADPDADMATLYAPFADDEDPTNPNLVKVVKNQHDHALYFSRSPIPFDRSLPDQSKIENRKSKILKHPGLYAYRRAFLLQYPNLEPTPLEQAEQLEQLRVLEHGHTIKLIPAPGPVQPGIDTPEQYAAFVVRAKSQNR